MSGDGKLEDGATCYLCSGKNPYRYLLGITDRVGNESCKYVCGDCYQDYGNVVVPLYIPYKQRPAYRIRKIMKNRSKEIV